MRGSIFALVTSTDLRVSSSLVGDEVGNVRSKPLDSALDSGSFASACPGSFHRAKHSSSR
jgi:hypothetical protein